MPEHSQWTDGRLDGLERDVTRLTDDIVPVVIQHSGELRNQGKTLKSIESLLREQAIAAQAKTWTTAQKIAVLVPFAGMLVTCVTVVLTKSPAPAAP